MSVLIVSPSDQGKTETIEIFAQQHDGVWLVPPSSETRVHQMFKMHRNITLIAIDEPYDWISKDYVAAAMMCKHILTGKITAPRTNYFVTGIAQKKVTKTGVIMLCNDNQFDKVRMSLFGCGLLERTLIVLTQHSSFDTMDYIRNHYRSHDKVEFVDEYQFCMRDVTQNERKFIDGIFTGHLRDTLTWIAKITPEKVFAELKPYLKSESDAAYVEETILFKD
jgi:hypothetical protein